MEILQFDKCCCCIDLRCGSFIIGYLGVFNSIVTIVVIAVGMATGYTLDNDITVKTPPGIGSMNIIATIIVGSLYVILLVGTYKRKPELVKVAWIGMMMCIALDAIARFTGHNNGVAAFGALVGICVSIYFTLCVRSYYLVLKEEVEPSSVGPVPTDQGGQA